MGQALDDGRLTCTRLADEDGVVLGSSAENLQQASYLIVATDDGVELSRARFFY